jgi:hypothetical protein
MKRKEFIFDKEHELNLKLGMSSDAISADKILLWMNDKGGKFAPLQSTEFGHILMYFILEEFKKKPVDMTTQLYEEVKKYRISYRHLLYNLENLMELVSDDGSMIKKPRTFKRMIESMINVLRFAEREDPDE